MAHSVLILFVLMAFGCASTPKGQESVEGRFHEWGIEDGKFAQYSPLAAEAIQENAGEKVEVWQASGPGGRRMKARRIESSLSAANLFQERLVKLRSIYEVHRDAYFSVITRETRCPQEFQLKEQALPHGKALTMFSNDRGTLGACSKDVAKMKVSIALLVCGPAFIQVESFVPLEVLNAADAEAVASLQCIR